jgi:predicted lactoylglutathione lyase
MLLTQEKFSALTRKEIVEAARTKEALLWLSTESKDKVSEMLNQAVKAGGSKAADFMDFASLPESGRNRNIIQYNFNVTQN